MAIQKIHHINFLVKDIHEGIKRYQALLGLGEFIVDDLPGRGVITARIALGEQWLVLVQPLDQEGIPGQHLAEHGEGFFLISYQVDSLDSAQQQLLAAGANMTSASPRQGLANWQVWDIDSKHTFGTQIQLCNETDTP